MRVKIYENNQLQYFPLYPCTIDINYSQEKVIRPNGFIHDQIFLVTNGSGIFSANNISYSLEKGDMFYISANIPHKYYGIDKNFKTSYLSFCGNGFENIKKYYNAGDFGVYNNKVTVSFEAQLAKLFECFENQNELSEICVTALATVTAFFDIACKKNYSPIETVYNYIENNYSKMITLEDITQFYPFSKSKLCYEFKQKYKMTIFEMLMKTRLTNARYMIQSNPNIKLRQVVQSCGFNDTSYFCKVYKNFYGESPKNSETDAKIKQESAI